MQHSMFLLHFKHNKLSFLLIVMEWKGFIHCTHQTCDGAMRIGSDPIVSCEERILGFEW